MLTNLMTPFLKLNFGLYKMSMLQVHGNLGRRAQKSSRQAWMYLLYKIRKTIT